jgi:hypothetical protein
MFNKLRRFALEGNIVFTVGNINDLSFLREEKILAIDVSTIPSTCPLTYDTNRQIAGTGVRVIWTEFTNDDDRPFHYYSYEPGFVSFSEQEVMVREFEKLQDDSLLLAHLDSRIRKLPVATRNLILFEKYFQDGDTDMAPIDGSPARRLALMTRYLFDLRTTKR